MNTIRKRLEALAWVGHAFAEDFREETSGSWEVELQGF